mmetsp:Transcript_14457/g.22308  ORF Transcript_14457/g.22308 Transcript_14457/m.22308 type:complete len:204 (+) Transcript_14457:655-1266(+)
MMLLRLTPSMRIARRVNCWRCRSIRILMIVIWMLCIVAGFRTARRMIIMEVAIRPMMKIALTKTLETTPMFAMLIWTALRHLRTLREASPFLKTAKRATCTVTDSRGIETTLQAPHASVEIICFTSHCTITCTHAVTSVPFQERLCVAARNKCRSSPGLIAPKWTSPSHGSSATPSGWALQWKRMGRILHTMPARVQITTTMI